MGDKATIRGNTYIPIIALIILLIVEVTISQSISSSRICGNIIDAETREPIAYANIFISNSSIGTASDRDGYFELRNLPYGRYEVIASVLGYEILKANVSIYTTSRRNFRFEMYKRPIEMEEVIVRGKISRKRKRQLDQFRRNLLGSSQNGKKSYITNEEVIRFEEKGNVLYAFAHEPLKIINNGLGYKIYYVLEEYQQSSSDVKYIGFPHFIELRSTTYHDSTDWPENRKNTYLGSLRHFLTIICENYYLTRGDVSERPFTFDWGDVVNHRTKMVYAEENHVDREGFFVTQVKYLHGNVVTTNIQLVNTNWFLSNSENENEMYLSFKNYLAISYDKEFYPFTSKRGKNQKSSWINMTCESTILDKDGRYFDKYAIQTRGLWSKERVADMLPFDYEINEK